MAAVFVGDGRIVGVSRLMHPAPAPLPPIRRDPTLQVIGNKGGQVVSFSLFNVSFCFVSAHLAAHEARSFYERRNQVGRWR